ncbi:uncharacterized protein [Amphiura filiformis]|uniref:uncharacterized protein isoform X2 n=1 Tax=Amphiura filiformis TaxID=82378 RepID=UPI003B20E643
MKILLIAALLFLLLHQYASAQDTEGITITCPVTLTVGSDGRIELPQPMTLFQLQTDIDEMTYTYLGRTQTELANANVHILTGFPMGTTPVEVEITDGIEIALCTFRAVRVEPTVACPDRLNPLSPNPSSLVSFNIPAFANFPNNANVQLTYRYSNLDVDPAVNNQLLAPIQSTPGTHSLNDLPCGSNTVTVTATDNAGNTASCTFTYFRLCVVCPNPVSSTLTSTSFTRPSVTFPLGDVVTYTYTYSGGTIGTFPFNQATTHVLQGFTTGTNSVTLTVRGANGNTVTCTYIYVVTGVPIVSCPNRLNPVSPNPSSQVSFNIPVLTNFPNNANVQLEYRYSNFDVVPPVNNQLLAPIQSTPATHSLSGLSCGSNTVTITATDNAGNTASCTFTYFRLCVVCPNPVSSTLTSTSFARPSVTFPLGDVVTYTYTYNGGTIGTFSFNQATTHVLQGFTTGTNSVTLTVTSANGNSVTCSYIYIVTGVPIVACPNRLNPVSPNPSSQVSFNIPALTNFPNNANVQLAYRYSNFDVVPPVNSRLLAPIQSTPATHSLSDLSCGSNTVTVTATDNAGNTASCTFTYFRLCVVCPNPISSTLTSTSFTRPSVTFPLGDVVTYTYTYNGGTIGTFSFNQATTHVLQGFTTGTNSVTLTVTGANSNTVTCTYIYVVTGVPTVACPNRLNPVSPNPSSQVSFNIPALTNFPNNANVQLAYRYSNFDVVPIQSTPGTHSLGDLSCGSNTVTVTATDNAGNTATCTFTYFRLCVVCPNPVSSTVTSTSFARPSVTFPLGDVVTYTYIYNGGTIGTFSFNQATTHVLQGFTTGTNSVTLTVTSATNTVTCTYIYVVTGVPMVDCPNRLNPLSPNPSSQVSFNIPVLTNFPNNANVQLEYRYSNFDMVPPVNNRLLAPIQSTPASYSLGDLPCGSNTVTVTATDNAGNTASCTFTYFRLCVVCPNPVSSTLTSTSFTRPSVTFPLGDVVTYTYTYNGGTIGTFSFNQATTHVLQGFTTGTNSVTLTVTGATSNTVTCTYIYVVTGVPTVACPNPQSPNPSSQVSFNSPTLAGFPNNAYIRLTYRCTNLGSDPQINDELLATIPSTQSTHSLNNLACGSNRVTVTATDNAGNTATCTFTYFRLCDACIHSNPCLNGGECISNPDNGDFVECLFCNTGYRGLYCHIYVCDSNFCANGATCVPIDSWDYSCRCPYGYFGDYCTDRDPCHSHPCLNGGRCIGDGVVSYTCECYNGYTGRYCETRPVCLNHPCYNGGRCYPDLSTELQYRCECVGPYTGTRCEIMSGCHDNPCGVNGICQNDGWGGYTCECIRGYLGRHCSIEPVCVNNPCINGQCEAGTSGNPICICNTGYTGTYCDRSACDNYCYNGGTCEFDPSNGSTWCRCTADYQGPQCREIASFRLCDINICLNGGTCWEEPDLGPVCTCVDTYGGDLCESRIISCDERDCVHGQCIEADFARGKTSRCRCNSGWQGDQCDQSTSFQNSCSPRNPCLNGGNCQLISQYSTSFKCNCRVGYTGDLCDEPTKIVKSTAESAMASLCTTVIALGLCLIFRRL